MTIGNKAPRTSSRTPHLGLGIAIAALSLAGLVIVLVLFSTITPAIAPFVLVALAGVNIYSAWQLLTGGGAKSPYAMRAGKLYLIVAAIIGVGGGIFTIISVLQTSDVSMVGFYFIIFATALRALYDKPRS